MTLRCILRVRWTAGIIMMWRAIISIRSTSGGTFFFLSGKLFKVEISWSQPGGDSPVQALKVEEVGIFGSDRSSDSITTNRASKWLVLYMWKKPDHMLHREHLCCDKIMMWVCWHTLLKVLPGPVMLPLPLSTRVSQPNSLRGISGLLFLLAL